MNASVPSNFRITERTVHQTICDRAQKFLFSTTPLCQSCPRHLSLLRINSGASSQKSGLTARCTLFYAHVGCIRTAEKQDREYCIMVLKIGGCGVNPSGRIYRKSPISEVVCEIRFEPKEAWDPTIPGLIFKQLESDFPIRHKSQTLEAGVLAGPNGIQQQFMMVERAQFYSSDEKSFVQIGPHYLSVNRLQPYSSWDDYYPAILKGLHAYQESVGSESSLLRVGLRYVNQIKLPGSLVKLEDFFHIYPEKGRDLPEVHTNLHLGLDFMYHDNRDILRLQLQSGPLISDGGVHLLLDLDYFLGRSNDVAYGDLPSWLAEAHLRIEECFEGSIKDSLRDLFEEVRDSNE